MSNHARRTIFFGTICAALTGACAIGDRTEENIRKDAPAQERWIQHQAKAMADSEAQAKVLARARASLDGVKVTVPRDAAICFEARNMMQRDLEAAMRSGGEFGPALDAWHAQSRGVETFCTYALTIGAPR